MAGSGRVILHLLVVWIAIVALSGLGEAKHHTYPNAKARKSYKAWLAKKVAEHESRASPDEVTGEFGYAKASEDTKVIYVDWAGNGDVKTVSKAIKAIPDKSSTRWIIMVAPGVYKESVLIPDDKGPITLIGAGNTKTKITFDQTGAEAGGTLLSSSVKVYSDEFIMKDIAIENSSPSPAPGAIGQQAVAFMIAGDKAAFYRVAFLGYQDTLYDRKGRHYFKDCYIRGTIDFIFGDGQSYYDSCFLDSVATTFGSLSAQKREAKKEDTGFSFVNSIVSGPRGYVYLGRAWGQFSRVVFIKTYLPVSVRPEGWFDWGVPGRYKTVYYGEYECYGPGSNRAGREWWSMTLTPQQAAPFLTVSWINGKSWLPEGTQ